MARNIIIVFSESKEVNLNLKFLSQTIYQRIDYENYFQFLLNMKINLIEKYFQVAYLKSYVKRQLFFTFILFILFCYIYFIFKKIHFNRELRIVFNLFQLGNHFTMCNNNKINFQDSKVHIHECNPNIIGICQKFNIKVINFKLNTFRFLH